MNYRTKRIEVRTTMKNEMIDITDRIKKLVSESSIEHGLVTLFVPHTTAAVTINENADPDVKADMLHGLDAISPDRKDYKHYEGNSEDHIKSSLVGVDQTIIIEDNNLLLGTWQGIYFCEFDGPRTRNILVKIL